MKTFQQRKYQFTKKKLPAEPTPSLLYAVKETDIIASDKNGLIYVNGTRISPEALAKLQSEVKFFKDTDLFRVLFGTPKEHAMRIMFEQSKSWDDMVAGKMLLYALDLQQKIMHSIERGKA